MHVCVLAHVPQLIDCPHIVCVPQLNPLLEHVSVHVASCLIVVNVVICHLDSWQSHVPVVVFVHV